jgi:hypothetical protein
MITATFEGGLAGLRPPLPYPACWRQFARRAPLSTAVNPGMLAWYNDRSVEWVLEDCAGRPEMAHSYASLVRVERLRSIDAAKRRYRLVLAPGVAGELALW